MSPAEQIKSRLSITDVVSGYLKLARAGSNFKAVCPFHSEKTPSFFVSPARDSWHCFGCQKGGDIFTFVMEIESVVFREALQILAQRAGVELQRENNQDRDERSRLFALMECAVQFYETHRARFPAVGTYLEKRGVKPETIAKFRIGYAPPETSGWRQFTEYALKKGYTLKELEKSGLIIKKQSPSYELRVTSYDRFRNRIMFPIAEPQGRVVAFGGRIFDVLRDSASGQRGSAGGEAPAKYINSPQTVLYDKSRILYAFDKAKMAIRREDACVVVEGYMDAIMAHQAGTEHAVAISGTAMTNHQLTLLRRLCGNIVLSFDMDDAGESATRRSIDLGLDMGFDVKAIAMPSGKDPADLVQSDPDAWRRAAAEAADIISYFLQKAQVRHTAQTIEGKRAISNSVLPLIARLRREVEKAHWVSVLSSRLGVREESVWEDMRRSTSSQPVLRQPVREADQRNASNSRSRAELLEDRILGIVYAHQISIPAGVTESFFRSEPHRALFSAFPCAVANIKNSELQQLLSRLVFEAEMLVSAENAAAECAACIGELEREHTKTKLEQLTHDIRQAEEAGNEQQLPQLIEEFRETSKQLASM